jgi:hypothetical protein
LDSRRRFTAIAGTAGETPHKTLPFTRKGHELFILNHCHDPPSFSLEPDMPAAIDLIWLSKLKVDFRDGIIGF